MVLVLLLLLLLVVVVVNLFLLFFPLITRFSRGPIPIRLLLLLLVVVFAAACVRGGLSKGRRRLDSNPNGGHGCSETCLASRVRRTIGQSCCD
jgi:hypothetical protein